MRNAITAIFATAYGLSATDLALLAGTPVDVARARLHESGDDDLVNIPAAAERIEARVAMIARTIVDQARAEHAAAQAHGMKLRFMIHVFPDNDSYLANARAALDSSLDPAQCIAALHRIGVWRAMETLRAEGISLQAAMFDPANPCTPEQAIGLMNRAESSVH